MNLTNRIVKREPSSRLAGHQVTPLGIEPRTLGLKVPLPFVLTVISMSLLCGGLFVPCTDVRQWAVLVVEPLQLPIVEDSVESCRDR